MFFQTWSFVTNNEDVTLLSTQRFSNVNQLNITSTLGMRKKVIVLDLYASCNMYIKYSEFIKIFATQVKKISF